MTNKQRDMALGAIIHAELAMDFPDEILDALNSVILFLATIDDEEDRKTGTWILHKGMGVWICDQCRKNPTEWMGYVQAADELFDYCPHCGAAMEGVQM